MGEAVARVEVLIEDARNRDQHQERQRQQLHDSGNGHRQHPFHHMYAFQPSSSSETMRHASQKTPAM